MHLLHNIIPSLRSFKLFSNLRPSKHEHFHQVLFQFDARTVPSDHNWTLVSSIPLMSDSANPTLSTSSSLVDPDEICLEIAEGSSPANIETAPAGFLGLVAVAGADD